MYAEYTDLIKEGNLGKQTSEEVLLPHIETAEIDIREMITDDVYESYEDKKGTVDYKRLLKAEINLALSYAVHSLNIETQGSGIVRSKGWDQSRSEMLSRNEVNDLSEHYKNIATNLLQPFIPNQQQQQSENETLPDELETGSSYMAAI